jgi:hypothetical protein
MPANLSRNDRSGTGEDRSKQRDDLTDKGVVAACQGNGAKLRIAAVPTAGSFRRFIDDDTDAWVKKLVNELSDAKKFALVTGHAPVSLLKSGA